MARLEREMLRYRISELIRSDSSRSVLLGSTAVADVPTGSGCVLIEVDLLNVSDCVGRLVGLSFACFMAVFLLGRHKLAPGMQGVTG